MERKTKVAAEEGRQDLVVSREFDLPVELLFRAHADPDLLAQWMGTRVCKLEAAKHGSWRFETTNAQGQVVFGAHGVFHEWLPGQKIVRTFEMDGAAFGVQLESLEFEALDEGRSALRMHIVYQSAAQRDSMLKLPFAQGITMAHNRLQEAAALLQER